MNKKISVVCPCYNEASVIEDFINTLLSEINKLKKYNFEILFIDNCSEDNTVDIIKKYIKKNKYIKVIVNTRNFGHIRSPYWGIIQSKGDATIYIASDLQDPPKLIKKFLLEWEKGFKVVMAVKNQTIEANFFIKMLRIFYYKFLNSISEVAIIKNATGFGLYDNDVLEIVRKIDDPYPFFRGLIAEIGYPIKTIEFKQSPRPLGFSKNNIYSLYDFALLGITNHSVMPLRICSLGGIILGVLSLLIALFYLGYKILYWDSFDFGIAPLIISIFFLFGLLLFFVGIIGEYLSLILKYLKKRPVVVEKERINFKK